MPGVQAEEAQNEAAARVLNTHRDAISEDLSAATRLLEASNTDSAYTSRLAITTAEIRDDLEERKKLCQQRDVLELNIKLQEEVECALGWLKNLAPEAKTDKRSRLEEFARFVDKYEASEELADLISIAPNFRKTLEFNVRHACWELIVKQSHSINGFRISQDSSTSLSIAKLGSLCAKIDIPRVFVDRLSDVLVRSVFVEVMNWRTGPKITGALCFERNDSGVQILMGQSFEIVVGHLVEQLFVLDEKEFRRLCWVRVQRHLDKNPGDRRKYGPAVVAKYLKPDEKSKEPVVVYPERSVTPYGEHFIKPPVNLPIPSILRHVPPHLTTFLPMILSFSPYKPLERWAHYTYLKTQAFAQQPRPDANIISQLDRAAADGLKEFMTQKRKTLRKTLKPLLSLSCSAIPPIPMKVIKNAVSDAKPFLEELSTEAENAVGLDFGLIVVGAIVEDVVLEAINQVLAQADIPAHDSGELSEALFDLSGLALVFRDIPCSKYLLSHAKLVLLSRILTASMQDILEMSEEITRQFSFEEIVALIKALFMESDRRDRTMRDVEGWYRPPEPEAGTNEVQAE